MSPTTALAARWAAAAALLVGGLVHIYLYYQGYRTIPNANLGRSFVANAVASALVAALLIATPHRLVRLAGVAVAGGTLVAFVLTRETDKGVFGFTEQGLNPSPEAVIALIAEIVAIVLLASTLVADGNVSRRTPLAVSVGALVVAAAATIGVGAAAAHKTTAAAPTAAAPTAAASTAATTTSAGAATAVSAVGGTGAYPVATAAGTSPASGAGATAAPPPGAPGTQAVDIRNFAFAPKDLKIAVGTKVTWTNQDSFAHNVASSDKSFASDPKLPAGQSYSYTFATAGTFTYICTIHSYMSATVTVT